MLFAGHVDEAREKMDIWFFINLILSIWEKYEEL
jgi:hypothetical protein